LKKSACWFIALLLLVPAIPVLAEDVILAKVVGVSDGDTITVLKDKMQIKVRLYGVDAPEKSQAFGSRARQFTSDLVFGKTVEVKPTDTDRYGRTVAWVFVDGRNLNEEIVRAGLAWHYKRYSRDENLARAEMATRAGNFGLWSDPHAIPPWEFRRAKKAQGPQTAAQAGYHGNISSKVFHRNGCEHYNCKNCTVVFDARDAAIAAGFGPCGRCRP